MDMNEVLNILSDLFKVYVFGRGEVKKYLEKHREMGRILLYLCAGLLDRFIQLTPPLCLELYRDPEIEDEYLILSLMENGLNKKKLRMMLNELSSQYFLTAYKSTGWLMFDIKKEESLSGG